MKLPLGRLASAFTLGVWVLGLAACQSQPSSQRLPDAEMPSIPGEGPGAVYVQLARAYLEQGQLAVAARRAEKAIEVEPSNVDAHIILGIAQSRLGYPDLAEQTLRKAEGLSPGDSYVANALGALYCGNSRLGEALDQFNAAVAAAGNQTPWIALTNAGICLRDQGKEKEAADYLRRALQSNPRFGPALLALSRLHYEGGDKELARTYVNRYFEVASPDPESLWVAYQIESATGNRQRADSYAELLKNRFPDAPQTDRLLGL